MHRRLSLGLLVLAAWPLAARAEHASIELRVMRLDAQTNQTTDDVVARADQEPPLGGVNPRPLFKAKAGEPLVFQFMLTNTYPHGDKKDVRVHYFVVKEQKLRQKETPDPARGAVTQGRFTMTFKPKCRVGARVQFTVKEPGLYLLRVQTENTDSDHEHFSAIDLQVE
jgi:hypothetical protein